MEMEINQSSTPINMGRGGRLWGKKGPHLLARDMDFNFALL